MRTRWVVVVITDEGRMMAAGTFLDPQRASNMVMQTERIEGILEASQVLLDQPRGLLRKLRG